MSRALRRLRRGVERLVGADVREGEWRLVMLFFANLFLLLSAYYILKVIREPLILLEGGAVSRSYARGLQAALLLVLLPVYGWLSERFEPAKLVKWIMGVFVICVAGFVGLGEARVRVGFAFFVWLGIFSAFSIAQFWSLASDVLSESEGTRLFPMVAAGGTLGGICGAELAARTLGDNLHALMSIAAVLLVSCALLSHLTHDVAMQHRARVPHDPGADRRERGGLALIARDGYLRLIALGVLLLNFVNTTGDFVLSQVVLQKADLLSSQALKRHYIAEFYGDFQAYVSALTLVVQLLLVARVFKKVGAGGAIVILPAFALLGYGTAALLPLLGIVAGIKVVQDSVEYSLQRTAHQALFLRTSRDAKYKARAAIDTLFMRLGDLVAALAVFIGAELGLGIVGYALSNVVTSVLWLGVALRVRQLSAAPRQGDASAPALSADDLKPRELA